MNKILRVLGIVLIVASLLLAIAVPPAGIAGVVFGILCIVRSRNKPSVVITQKPVVTEKSETLQVAEKSIVPVNHTIGGFQLPGFVIHDDIKNLLWIADGKYKNYAPAQKAPDFEYCGMKIYFTLGSDEEPSLIYSKQPIQKPKDETVIDRPPYYPRYSGLTPEQRYIYAKLLTNPYNPEIDIGYVFILYYGLERHLLCGDFDSAFKVILKLRDVHRNGSFQSYSANALILTSMLHGLGEYALAFVASLDKEYEFNFSSNLFLICYYSFNLPLSPNDIMRMATTFEFTNRNYIKKNPDIFEKCLSDTIVEKYHSDGILISNFITKTELSRIKMDNCRLFANMSLLDKEIPVPMLSDNFKLKKAVYDLLVEAHERTKKALAETRKKENSKIHGQVIYQEREIPDDSKEAHEIRARAKMTSQELAAENRRRMEASGLKLYVWSTAGDERVRPSHALLDEKLCKWADPTVYSSNRGKTWKPMPKGAALCHPGEEEDCRCTALSYEPELLGEI